MAFRNGAWLVWHFYRVAAADGVIWMGHDTGIIMIRLPNEPVELPSEWEEMTVEQRSETGLGPLEGMTKLSVRLDGPVIFLDPLMLGGGVAYVSESGGFGVVAEQLQLVRGADPRAVLAEVVVIAVAVLLGAGKLRSVGVITVGVVGRVA